MKTFNLEKAIRDERERAFKEADETGDHTRLNRLIADLEDAQVNVFEARWRTILTPEQREQLKAFFRDEATIEKSKKDVN